jgi:ribose transport system ATP-binding protein
MTSEPILRIHGIHKSFFGVPVLREVSMALWNGEVLGLVGENGAGKSTLMNILGGVLPADSGRIELAGAPWNPGSPADARNAGIGFVHQELSLFPNLTVAENVMIGQLPVLRRSGIPLLDRRRLRKEALGALGEVGLTLDPATPLAALSPGERQLVEIARVLRGNARIVIFDEPTTSLTHREREHMFGIIGRLRQGGMAIIYISHNLADVLRLCDRIVVLRDGEVVGEGPAAAWTERDMIPLMVGRKLEQQYPPHTSIPGEEKVLEVTGLSSPGLLGDVSFCLRRGEILGVAGLLGAGRTELARALFGLDSLATGGIILQGREVSRGGVQERLDGGMGFVTEDRREEGLLADASVSDNIALAAAPLFARRFAGFEDRRSLLAAVRGAAGETGIKPAALEHTRARTLSGGNQQKVVIAKWLLRKPSVLILDEPTRGIDVGARHEIIRLIDSLAARGTAVIFISSEIEELIATCDRIVVMRFGEIATLFGRDEFDRERILRSALLGT